MKNSRKDKTQKLIIDTAHSALAIQQKLLKGEKIPGFIICARCKGTGWDPDGNFIPCKKCYGRGFIVDKDITKYKGGKCPN